MELVAGQRMRPGEGTRLIFRAHTAASSAALQLCQHDHEFVPAMPADGVGGADARRQFPCDGSKQLVAKQVSERVVDRFEVDRYPERGPPAAAGGGGPGQARGSAGRPASGGSEDPSVDRGSPRWENCRAVSSECRLRSFSRSSVSPSTCSSSPCRTSRRVGTGCCLRATAHSSWKGAPLSRASRAIAADSQNLTSA